MDTNADNVELNQDELIIQQQRQIEKEVSTQPYRLHSLQCTTAFAKNVRRFVDTLLELCGRRAILSRIETYEIFIGWQTVRAVIKW